MTEQNIYIVSKNDNNKWQVKKEGSTRALKLFDNKEDAVTFAKETAKNQKATFKILDDEVVKSQKTSKMTNEKLVEVKQPKKKGFKKVFIIILGLLIGIGAGAVSAVYEHNSLYSDFDENNNVPGVVTNSNLSIHFLQLGNKYTGDSIFIKAGETDILIDAGSRKNSAGAIKSYVDQYCTDGILEYVIATHADQDHISGFVGTTKIPGILKAYTAKTIIKYAKTNSTSATKTSFENLVNDEVKSEGAVVYSALDCYNETNGAKKTFEIAAGITMTILYNYYYDHTTSDENNNSVCLMINDGQNNYLFTGDLEKEGEEKLVEHNTLPTVKLFKAGHHGSKTSSTEALLSVIKPEIVTVCCSTGSDEYTDNILNMFPTQDFVTRVKKYTEKIYVTTIISDNSNGYEPLNGTIVISLIDGEVVVNCSNNNTYFKDTQWFKQNRTW